MNALNSDMRTAAAICVLSFDGASDLWLPFFDALQKAWPDTPLTVYLVTNHKIYEGPHEVITLAIGDDVDWSSNLLLALERIKENHILFIFDDFIPRSIDILTLEYYLNRAIVNDWPYLTLHPNNYMEGHIEPGIRQIAEHGVYRCTLLYGIFRKDVLKGLLKPGESAWEFEIESGIRARGLPLYSVEKRIFRHYHLLRKGMWMRPGYPRLVKQYDLNKNRPIESMLGYFMRETKEWLFRRYHRIMPGKFIEHRESRRRD